MAEYLAAHNLPTEFAIAPHPELRAGDVVGSYEDAWDRLRGTGGPGFMPRNVMLVAGPSRSADIESTLELGAHGPRRVHIILVDDDPAAVA